MPPTTTVAPFAVASVTCSSALSTALPSISGPIVVPALIPSPTLSAWTAAVSFATNASWTPSWTSRRFAQTQVWPALRNFETIAPLTAASRSASSKTMNGALPPSSIDVFLTVAAHCASSTLPISVDPVKLSFRTVGFDVSSPPMSPAEPVTHENTPCGMPARCASSESASAVNGVWLAGFSTIVQPAASAGPAFRVIIAAGKFHGVIAAQTPIGCFSTTMRRSAAGAGMVSP